MKYLAHSAKPERGIPEQAYADHVSDVVHDAVVNAENAALYSPTYGALLRAAVRLAAEFHDLGKLDEQNQHVLKTGRGSLPINHVDAGIAHIFDGQIDRVHQVAATLIYAHHRGLPSLPEECARGTGKAFRDDRSIVSGIPLKTHTNIFLADYCNRHSSVVSALPPTENAPLTTAVSPLFFRLALSCLVDADHSDTARHYKDPLAAPPRPLDPLMRLCLLDRYVEELANSRNDKRTHLRSLLYQVCRNADSPARMLACDSPVGSGKTTAVMAHLLKVAHERELRRVFVVLPFTNIIDQSVSVYRNALVQPDEDANAIVAAHHHKAEFDDPSARQFAFLWHAPIVVTTAVQFFETLAAATPSALRKLHQLPGAAIFIDESHAALPAHLWPQAWKWLWELEKDWGSHIVFGSGSLNHFWELCDFVDPPVVLPTLVDCHIQKKAAAAEEKRIEYRSHPDVLDLNTLADFLKTTPGPRLLIVNTVQSAAAIARYLAKRFGLEHVEHLSTALTPRDRKAALDFVRLRLQRPNHRNWTLVATSCIEAGVDLSFQTGIRERCSLSSLLQTAGRVNRSNEYKKVIVWDIQLNHDSLLRPHPAFDTSSRILGELFNEGKVSPESCTEALRREIRQKEMDKDNIITRERNADFPSIEQLFRVIASDTVTVVADPSLIQQLEHGEKVSFDDLQLGSVQIWQDRVQDLKLEDVENFVGIKKWSMKYDAFLGYMAGILPLIDMDQAGFTII
jgi:CRISPR-associated endonuclease/helicase Cas3